MSPAGRRLATFHMVLNLTGVALFAISLVLRWGDGALGNDRWPLAFGLALVAFAGLGAAGWIGGKLVFEHKVGVVENQDSEATEIGRREAAAGIALVVALAALLAGACGGKISTKAVDQAAVRSTEQEKVGDIQVPDGFRAVRVAEGLTYPSSITWDDQGRLYVLESHTVAIPGMEPRVLRVKLDPEGSFEEVELDRRPGAHRRAGGGDRVPRRLALPVPRAEGRHLGDQPVPPGRRNGRGGAARLAGGRRPLPELHGVRSRRRALLRLGQRHQLRRRLLARPGEREVAQDAAAGGGHPLPRTWSSPARRSPTTNAMTQDDEADKATTGAYQTYGQADARRIAARPLCTGAIYRLPPGRQAARARGLGLPQPGGAGLRLDGPLFVGMHGADVRGTRPVLDDPDAIYRVRAGAWYGWPDYSAALAALYRPALPCRRRSTWPRATPARPPSSISRRAA